MIALPHNTRHSLKLYLFTLAFFYSTIEASSQNLKTDSLRNMLAKERADSNKVKLMWQLAKIVYTYNPDMALQLAQDALFLAKRTKFEEGQSLSLGILATTFRIIGNYPQALELNLQRLQLEEKRNVPGNLAKVLMNIGIIYRFQEEYDRALGYYARADSVISKNNIEDLKPIIALNIGDSYDLLGIFDSSYKYYRRSLRIAQGLRDDDLIGQSMTGLGHSYRKIGNDSASLSNYQNAINYLRIANDDETLCEATLGLATLYQKLKQYDSSGYYASLSLSIAKKDGFSSREYEATQFLTGHYKKIKNIDSAFAYAEYSRQLNDSLNSKARIRELQILSSNEQFRQRELEEERKIAEKRRHQQLQLLLIGIFIPGLFLTTLLLSRRKIHIRVIKALGILSLLFFFEYLTLWLHPTVAELTGHTPILEIMIFVGIAAILIPLHHRTEHWLIDRLIHHRVYHGQTKKLHMSTGKKNHPLD
jgi:tetratricopeptide (TPR) repeat protein